jgi:predicted ester cyclase
MIAGHDARSESVLCREAIEELFARRQQAYDRLDSATLAADYADDIVIDSPITGQHGKADAVRNIDAVFDAFVDMKLATTALIIDSPWVVQTAIIEGSNLGRLFGVPPSGKRFRISAAFVYRLRADRIVFEQRIYDCIGLLEQVGVRRAKPA